VVSFFLELYASHFSISSFSGVSVAIIVVPFAHPCLLFFRDPALRWPLNCFGLPCGGLPLPSSEVSSGDVMVDISETAGCEAIDVNASLETMPLILGISWRVPAITFDSLVAVVGSGLSVTLLGRTSESTSTLQSDGNNPACLNPAKILDGVMVSLLHEEQCLHFQKYHRLI
jgi:hypothetical protein